MTRIDIRDAAVALLGTPFRHRGRSASGTDCIGLVILVGKEIGAFSPHEDYLDYEKMPRAAHFDRLSDRLDRIRLNQIRTGSILLFKRRMPCHVGICEEDGRVHFLHAFEKRGSVVRDNLGDYTRAAHLSLSAAYDFRGVDG